MPSSQRDLTDAQWEFLDSLIPEPPRRRDGRGRPWRGRREVLSGILFILRTGAPWADLPTGILLTRPATADSSNGFAPVSCAVCWKLWRRTCAAVVDSIWKKPSSTAALLLRKRGARRWQNQARQRNQNHGRCRPPWSSDHGLRRKRDATRSQAGDANPGRDLRGRTDPALDWRQCLRF